MKIKAIAIICAHLMLLTHKSNAQWITSGSGTPSTTNLNTDGKIGIGIGNNLPNAFLHVKSSTSNNTQIAKFIDDARYIGLGRDEVAAFDVATGLWDDLYLGGDGKITIKKTGLVGIGTKTPDKMLTVVSAGVQPVVAKFADATNYIGLGRDEVAAFNVSNGTLTTLHLGGNSKLSVTPNGHVGIGTGTPKEHLQIGDRFVFHDGGNKYLGYNMYYDIPNGVNKTLATNDYASAITFGNGDLAFITAPFVATANTLVSPTTKMIIKNDGRVRIGTLSPSSPHTNALLAVDGKVACKSLYVLKATSWSDFVFKGNNLEKLEEVELFIKKNKHLPGVPSEEEILENGYDINEMDAKLLEKIETLYLHIIALEKEVKELKNK